MKSATHRTAKCQGFTALRPRHGLRELDRNARQHLRDDRRRREVLESRLRLQDETVRERWPRELFHVVGQDEVTSLNERERLRRARERERSARRRAEVHV